MEVPENQVNREAQVHCSRWLNPNLMQRYVVVCCLKSQASTKPGSAVRFIKIAGPLKRTVKTTQKICTTAVLSLSFMFQLSGRELRTLCRAHDGSNEWFPLRPAASAASPAEPARADNEFVIKTPVALSWAGLLLGRTLASLRAAASAELQGQRALGLTRQQKIISVIPSDRAKMS